MSKPLPWLRLYNDFPDNIKVRALPEPLQLRYVWFLCLERRGRFSGRSDAEVAWLLRLTETDVTESRKQLAEAGLIDPGGEPHDWQERQSRSDSSAERTRKWRKRKKESHGDASCDVTVTPLDTDIDIEKKRPERNSPPATPPSALPANAARLAQLLADRIKANNTKARIPASLDKWAQEIERLQRIDGNTWSEIEKIIEWSQRDTFWHKNILSAGTLRKQFARLWAAAGEAGGRQGRGCEHTKPGRNVFDD